MKVGTKFRYEGKCYVVTEYDGFMLFADNLDPDDMQKTIGWIGNAHKEIPKCEVIECD